MHGYRRIAFVVEGFLLLPKAFFRRRRLARAVADLSSLSKAFSSCRRRSLPFEGLNISLMVQGSLVLKKDLYGLVPKASYCCKDCPRLSDVVECFLSPCLSIAFCESPWYASRAVCLLLSEEETRLHFCEEALATKKQYVHRGMAKKGTIFVGFPAVRIRCAGRDTPL